MPFATDIRTVGSIIAGVATAGVVSVAVLAGGQPAELATVRAASVQPSVVELVPASTSDAVATALVVSPPTTTPAAPPKAVAPVAPSPQAAPKPAAAAPAPAPAPATAPPVTVAPAPERAPARTAATRDTACEAAMIKWGNEARAAHGLPALATDTGIQWIPVEWSDAMAAAQDLSHNPNYGDRIFAARPQAMTAGENVGRTTGDMRLVFDEFMKSPGHRSKILAGEHTHTSAGCVRDAGGQLWVTVNFWG